MITFLISSLWVNFASVIEIIEIGMKVEIGIKVLYLLPAEVLKLNRI